MVGYNSVRTVAFVTTMVGIFHVTQFTPMTRVILGTPLGVAFFDVWLRSRTILRKMSGIKISTRSTFMRRVVFQTTNSFAILSRGKFVTLSRGVISIVVLAKGAFVSRVNFGASFCFARSRAVNSTMIGRAIATAATVMFGVSLSTTKDPTRLH